MIKWGAFKKLAIEKFTRCSNLLSMVPCSPTASILSTDRCRPTGQLPHWLRASVRLLTEVPLCSFSIWFYTSLHTLVFLWSGFVGFFVFVFVFFFPFPEPSLLHSLAVLLSSKQPVPNYLFLISLCYFHTWICYFRHCYLGNFSLVPHYWYCQPWVPTFPYGPTIRVCYVSFISDTVWIGLS